MRNWYSTSGNIKLKDGSQRKEYHLVFETDDKKVRERVEKFFQKLMDEVK